MPKSAEEYKNFKWAYASATPTWLQEWKMQLGDMVQAGREEYRIPPETEIW